MREEKRVIEVISYNSEWQEEYLNEAEKIRTIMTRDIIKTHHIGSTSIPGMSAKPVIDILVEVKDINNIDKYNNEMEKLGYIPKGENGIFGRRFFLKGLYNRTHHIHTFQEGNSEIQRHLNFRDYMIAHPEEAKRYGELKIQLANKFRHDIESYINGKDSFIKDIDRKAEKWSKMK